MAAGHTRGRGMTFTATHARAFVGSDITVTVTAGADEKIMNVTVQLDGFLLDEFYFNYWS